MEIEIENHSFEATVIAPGSSGDWEDSYIDPDPKPVAPGPVVVEPAKPKAGKEPIVTPGAGTGFNRGMYGAASVGVIHPGAQLLDTTSPLAAPGHGNNALLLGGTGTTAEATIWTNAIDEVQYGDEYTFTLALALPKGATAPARLALTASLSDAPEITKWTAWTLLREPVKLAETAAFEDHSVTFTIPKELHGMLLHVGVYFFGLGSAGALVDNFRVTRVRPNTPLPEPVPSLLNGSFEMPSLAANDYLRSALHWVVGGSFGGIAHHTGGIAEAQDGNQVLDLSDGTTAVSSVVAYARPGVTYRAKVAVTAREDFAATSAALRLTFDSTSVGDASSYTPVALTWTDLDVCFTAEERHAGMPVAIQLESRYHNETSGRALFDNVRFSEETLPCYDP